MDSSFQKQTVSVKDRDEEDGVFKKQTGNGSLGNQRLWLEEWLKILQTGIKRLAATKKYLSQARLAKQATQPCSVSKL